MSQCWTGERVEKGGNGSTRGSSRGSTPEGGGVFSLLLLLPTPVGTHCAARNRNGNKKTKGEQKKALLYVFVCLVLFCCCLFIRFHVHSGRVSVRPPTGGCSSHSCPPSPWCNAFLCVRFVFCALFIWRGVGGGRVGGRRCWDGWTAQVAISCAHVCVRFSPVVHTRRLHKRGLQGASVPASLVVLQSAFFTLQQHVPALFLPPFSLTLPRLPHPQPSSSPRLDLFIFAGGVPFFCWFFFFFLLLLFA